MSDSHDGAGTDRSEKIALTNVRVFDGRELRGPTTVVIEGGIVGNDSAGARIIDAGGATLLPGLIDAHVHLLKEEHLQQLADFGVTTALDMGAWPPSMVDSLRNRTGMADIRSAGIPATTAGSTHSHLPGYPAGELVDGPTGAARFVTDRIAEGADYIKLIADIPGPDQETLDALVATSHDARQAHRRTCRIHGCPRHGVAGWGRHDHACPARPPAHRVHSGSRTRAEVRQHSDVDDDEGHRRPVRRCDRFAARGCSRRLGRATSRLAAASRNCTEPVCRSSRVRTPTPAPAYPSHPATAKACTTSSNCSSKRACRPSRRCARRQYCQPNTSGYTTEA